MLLNTNTLDWQVNKAENAIANVIFAHGAGANMNSAFIQELTIKFTLIGLNVYRFNFPYMTQRGIDGKRRPPNKMDVLLAEYEKAINSIDDELPLFIGGKSMGCRVAVMASGHRAVSGVFCLGYPFHPQKKPDKLRLEPLHTCHKPVVIVQGTRDPLGSKEEIEQYGLAKNIHIEFVEDGDHDLKPRVKSGFTHAQHKATAVYSIERFIKLCI